MMSKFKKDSLVYKKKEKIWFLLATQRKKNEIETISFKIYFNTKIESATVFVF